MWCTIAINLLTQLRIQLSHFTLQTNNCKKTFHCFDIYIYMLFAGWEVRIVKSCDRGLENAARGRRPRAAFSSPRSQFFTIRTDHKPAYDLFIYFLL